MFSLRHRKVCRSVSVFVLSSRLLLLCSALPLCGLAPIQLLKSNRKSETIHFLSSLKIAVFLRNRI